MEKSCSFPSCKSKPAFICRCKAPSVLICDSHFSSHIKQKALNHQYEFISIQPSSPQPEKTPARLASPVKHEEIKKLIENLPESVRKTLLPPSQTVSSPKSSNLFASLPKSQGKVDANERINYSDEDYYEGEVENGREHGSGKFFGNWKNCKLEYVGEWRFGLPHGLGQLSWNNKVMKGTWYQGSLTGDGELELENGDEFIGEFFENRFNGNGIYCFVDGYEMKGYFKDHCFKDSEFFTCVDVELNRKFECLKEKDQGISARFQVISEIFTHGLKRFKDIPGTIQNCYFFKNNSLQIMKIDTDNLEKTEISVETSQRLPSLGGMCEIDSVLFHAGGLIGEKSTGLSLVFNPETHEIKWLEPCYKRSTPCCLPLHPKVYIFGGADIFLNFIKDCESFSFESQSWSPLPALPMASDSMSGGVIGNLFVLSGYMLTKVYIFDTEREVYLNTLDLPDFKDKVFCVEQGTGFLMCNKKLYESKIGNPYEWKVVRDIVYNSGWPVSVPVRREDCFFWYTTDKEVWKFDRNTKGVFLLKKFK